MISLIICCRTPIISETLLSNIKKSIGLRFELITIDNSDGIYNIFEAYNIGVQQSKGDILCFMHDDIIFHSKDWGIKILDHFKDINTGAIGIAGSPYLSKETGSWWGSELVNEYLAIVNDNKVTIKSKYDNGIESNKKRVVTLDGVFLCIRKNLFNSISFDNKIFSGFHFYDIDICVQIFMLNYKLYCVYDILISHNSIGDMSQRWIENALLFNKKWKNKLPLLSIALPYTKQINGDLKTIREMADILITNGESKKKIYYNSLRKIFTNSQAFLYSTTWKYLAYFSFQLIKNII